MELLIAFVVGFTATIAFNLLKQWANKPECER